MNNDKLLQELFLFLAGKRQAIGIEHIKSITTSFIAACSRIDSLVSNHSYLWVNKDYPAKLVVKLKKHGRVAIGKN